MPKSTKARADTSVGNAVVGTNAATTAGTATAGSAAKVPTLENAVLRIESLKEQAARVGRKLVPLSDDCPREHTYWRHSADLGEDRRDLDALTLEYESQEQDSIAHSRVSSRRRARSCLNHA